MPPFNPWIGVSALVSVGAAWWVHSDAVDAGVRQSQRLLWTLLTAVLLIVGLPGYLLVGRPTQKAPRQWGLAEVVGATMAVFLLVLLIARVLSLGVRPELPDLSAGILLQTAVMILIVLYVVVVRYRLPPSAVGIQTRGLGRLAVLGLGLGLASIPISAFAEQIAMEIAGLIVGPTQAQRMNDLEHAMVPVDRILRGPVNSGDVALIIGLLCVAVPVAEELFFRGFAFGAMRARWSAGLAVAASAAFFAAVHLQIIHFLPIMALGALLALAYARTNSLLPPLIIHAVNNLVAILSALFGWNV